MSGRLTVFSVFFAAMDTLKYIYCTWLLVLTLFKIQDTLLSICALLEYNLFLENDDYILYCYIHCIWKTNIFLLHYISVKVLK